MPVVHENDNFVVDSDIHDHVWNGDSLNLFPVEDGYIFTGIDPIGIAQDGQELVLCNQSDTYSVMIKHDDSNSTDGNRFFFPDDSDHMLDPFVQVWGIRRENVLGRIGYWMQF